jgi:hypothetical protein
MFSFLKISGNSSEENVKIESDDDHHVHNRQSVDYTQYYNTLYSQKSLFTDETRVTPFLQGQILFDDGQQRLRQVKHLF